jgi:hypothetical protein
MKDESKHFILHPSAFLLTKQDLRLQGAKRFSGRFGVGRNGCTAGAPGQLAEWHQPQAGLEAIL